MEPVRPTEPPEASPPDAPLPDLPSSDVLRELRARAGSLLHGQRDLSVKLEQRLEECLDNLAQNLADQTAEDQTHGLASLDAARQAFEEERATWQAQREADAQRLKEQSEQIAEQRDQLTAERERLAADEAKRDAREAGLEQALQQALEEARVQGDQANDEQVKSLVEQHEADRTEIDSLTAKLSEANDALAQATVQLKLVEQEAEQAHSHLAEEQEAHSQTIEELNQRFELAVDDAQQHRQRIAELEQELATRPAEDQSDSAELAHLRETCDDLRRQVKQFESQPPAADDSNAETAELQRRFEMAVEDLRQLKREKAHLEEQLANSSPAAVPVGDENDWEAQKRRFLASLEDEALEGQMSPERQQERATIEGTISITDEVISGKDEVIADLRRRLAAAPESGGEAAVVIDHAFDDDERLENERARLVALEEQLREKLRQSELELSVERAKLARLNSELERKRIDLEALRDSLPARAATPSDAGGRRQGNWLKKLGLGGDED
jgi:chromosome segregation ATPase